MNPLDQIAAEAWQHIRNLPEELEFYDIEGPAIIKTAIQKATESLRNENVNLLRSLNAAQGEIIEMKAARQLASRAAHSSAKATERKQASEPAPIKLSDDQEKTVKQWAEDDRLWTTQETVEFNLRVFARSILSHSRAAQASEQIDEDFLEGRVPPDLRAAQAGEQDKNQVRK